MSTVLIVLVYMGMSFINTIKKQWSQNTSDCLPLNNTNRLWTSIHGQFVSVKPCGSQDRELYADLTALHHSQVFCQSPSPNYAPRGSVLSGMSAWHGNRAVRHDIGIIQAVMYMPLQYLTESSVDWYRSIITLVFSMPFLCIGAIFASFHSVGNFPLTMILLISVVTDPVMAGAAAFQAVLYCWFWMCRCIAL